MELDRRSFIKAAAVTGAAVAAASLPTSAIASESSSSASSTALHTWEVVPEPITDIAETKDYDIVIVGAGIAGLSAAEAATRCGAKTAIIERTDSYQMRGVDVGHIGSKWHQENTDVEIPPRKVSQMLHQWAQQTTNYDLIYTWASKSGKVFDHIEEVVKAQGMHFVHALSGTAKYGWDELPERWRVYPDAISVVFSDDDTDTRSDGKNVNWNLGDALYTTATAAGAEFIYNTHAEQLVGDATSGITGVIASTEDGKYVQYNAAKGVILATGDICGNQEMIDAFAPLCNRADANLYAPAGANSGDAILMTCWAGGCFSKSPAAPMVHQFATYPIPMNLTAFYMSWLAVNINGERYGAEIPFEPYLTNARMAQPDSKAFSIFDSDYATYMQTQWPTKYEKLLDGIEDSMATAIESGFLVKADTIEDLAAGIGVPADALAASVDRYNSMYAAGEDSDFSVPQQFLSEIKTAPFYACPVEASVLTIPFGIHVDKNSQALTPDDQPIAGLYACGNAQGDFFGLAYPVHCPGISHGRSVTFGQLLGEALATDVTISDLYNEE